MPPGASAVHGIWTAGDLFEAPVCEAGLYPRGMDNGYWECP